MDHMEERRDTKEWDQVKNAVIRPLLHCMYKRDKPGEENVSHLSEGHLSHLLSESHLSHLLAIFLTNCVDAGSNTVGLFPTFSLLSHSCVTNTRRCAEDGRIQVRAAVPVSKGEELTTSYKNPELGSVARRSHFPATWYFHCTCPRCSSPSELGGHLSSLLCQTENCQGYLVPTHALEYNSPWSCDLCSYTLSSCQAMDIQLRLFRQFSAQSTWTVETLETVVKEMEQVAHPTHYLLLQAKKSLILLPFPDPTGKLAVRKISLCEEWLSAMEKVDPGYSVTKGRVMEELARARLRVLRQGDGGKVQLLLGMKEIMRLLKEAGRCMQFDTREMQ